LLSLVGQISGILALSARSPLRKIGGGRFRFGAATCGVDFNLPNFVFDILDQI